MPDAIKIPQLDISDKWTVILSVRRGGSTFYLPFKFKSDIDAAGFEQLAIQNFKCLKNIGGALEPEK